MKAQTRSSTSLASADFYPTAAEARAGLRQMHREAGGAVVLRIVRPYELDGLVTASMAGDREARATIDVVVQFVQRAAQAPQHDPMTCVSCRHRVRRMQFSVAVVLPLCDDLTGAIAVAICQGCGIDLPTISAKAQAYLRRTWPDARPIVMTHATGGRA